MITWMNQFGYSVWLVNGKLYITLFPTNWTTQCIFVLIVKLKSKLLKALYILKIWKTLFLYFSCKLSHIFSVIFLYLKFNLILPTKTNEKLKLLKLFSIFVRFFLAYFKKPMLKLWWFDLLIPGDNF